MTDDVMCLLCCRQVLKCVASDGCCLLTDRRNSVSLRQCGGVTGALSDEHRSRLYLGTQHGTWQDTAGHRIGGRVSASHQGALCSHHSTGQHAAELGGRV